MTHYTPHQPLAVSWQLLAERFLQRLTANRYSLTAVSDCKERT